MTLRHHALADRIEIGQDRLPKWSKMKRLNRWMVYLGERNSCIPQWKACMPYRI